MYYASLFIFCFLVTSILDAGGKEEKIEVALPVIATAHMRKIEAQNASKIWYDFPGGFMSGENTPGFTPSSNSNKISLSPRHKFKNNEHFFDDMP